MSVKDKEFDKLIESKTWEYTNTAIFQLVREAFDEGWKSGERAERSKNKIVPFKPHGDDK